MNGLFSVDCRRQLWWQKRRERKRITYHRRLRRVAGRGGRLERGVSRVVSSCWLSSIYRVYPSNKQKQNWKIDTSLVAIGAQNLFFSLYKLGVNFLWIREILKMYISPSFSNRKKVQYYRFCIFKGVSKLDLLHSTGHKSLKNGSKSNNLGSLIKFRKFLAR